MMMAFGWQSNKIFQTVVIFNSVNVMDLPSFRCWTMRLFPNDNMFKDLMTGIGTGMVSKGKKDIAISVFNSPSLPIWIILAYISSSVLDTKFRTADNHFPTDRTVMLVAIFVCLAMFMCFIISMLVFFFCSCSHIGIIAERKMESKLMRQAPSRSRGNDA